MARNEILIHADPEQVFAVLADGRSYGHWVVGSSEIREVEPGFPAAGTRFHHKVGFGPLKIADHTLVEESEPPRRLKLRTRARPLGTALVTLDLVPHPEGTRVLMVEEAGDALTALLLNPLIDRLVVRRNDESLRRLKQLAEGRGPSMEQAAAP